MTANWPRRFRDSIEILTISSLRCLYLYIILSLFIRRPFIAAPALVEWLVYLVVFTHYAFSTPRNWSYPKWIGITFFMLLLSALCVALSFYKFKRHFDRLDRTAMDLEGLPYTPNGRFPRQWTASLNSLGVYVVWTLLEFFVLRQWSVVCAVRCMMRVQHSTVLKKRVRHLQRIGAPLEQIESIAKKAHQLASDTDHVRRRRSHMVAAKLLVLISWILWTACAAVSAASFLNLYKSLPCNDEHGRPCYHHCEPTIGAPSRSYNCLLPFPSMHFMRPDETSRHTHHRVRIPDAATPLLRTTGEHFGASYINGRDGFSVATPIMFHFGRSEAAKTCTLPAGAPTEKTLGSHTSEPVVLIDAETGERQPVWIEIDPHHKDGVGDDDDCIVMAHSAFPLRNARRYIVGVRDFYNNEGKKIERPAAFEEIVARAQVLGATQRQRRRSSSHHHGYMSSHTLDLLRNSGAQTSAQAEASVDNAAERLQYDILPLLRLHANNKTDAAEWQLAWDFYTESSEQSTHTVLELREAILDQVEMDLEDSSEEGAESIVSITSTVPEECNHENVTENTGRIVHGSFRMPNFLMDDNAFISFLRRDERGVLDSGDRTVQLRFTVYITCSALASPSTKENPIHLVEYGHPLTGVSDDFTVRPLEPAIRGRRWVIFCAEWRAVNFYDMYNTMRSLGTDAKNLYAMSDTIKSSMAESSVVLDLILNGVFDRHPEFHRGAAAPLGPPRGAAAPLGPPLNPEASAIGTNQLGGFKGGAQLPPSVFENTIVGGYWGHSFGAITGSGYAFLSPHIKRAALTSGGTPSGTTVYRSTEYDDFQAFIMRISFFTQHDTCVLFGLVQTSLGSCDATAWVSQHLYALTLENVPDKRFLIQSTVGDKVVPENSAHDLARTLAAQGTIPSLRPIYGVTRDGQSIVANSSESASPSSRWLHIHRAHIDALHQRMPSTYTEFQFTPLVEGDYINLHCALRFTQESTQSIGDFLEQDTLPALTSVEQSPCFNGNAPCKDIHPDY